jgi:hypothetical protein
MVRHLAQLLRIEPINAPVGILSALNSQGERVFAPPCLRHIYNTDPLTHSRIRAVPSTDADTPNASYIVA